MQIEEIEEVWWEDRCRMPLEVPREDFGPLIVAIDAHGDSLYRDVQDRAKAKLEESYARL